MALEPLMKLRGAGLRIGIVTARFNTPICERLLSGARRALDDMGVEDRDVFAVTVPGALEIPLALQALAASEQFDALIALGAVIKGDTYHFEVVCNESAAGITRVGLDLRFQSATASSPPSPKRRRPSGPTRRATRPPRRQSSSRCFVSTSIASWARHERAEHS